MHQEQDFYIIHVDLKSPNEFVEKVTISNAIFPIASFTPFLFVYNSLGEGILFKI